MQIGMGGGQIRIEGMQISIGRELLPVRVKGGRGHYCQKPQQLKRDFETGCSEKRCSENQSAETEGFEKVGAENVCSDGGHFQADHSNTGQVAIHIGRW